MFKKIHRRCFDIRQSNLLRLQIALANFNWKPLLHEANVQLLYDDLTKILTYFINFLCTNQTNIIASKIAAFHNSSHKPTSPSQKSLCACGKNLQSSRHIGESWQAIGRQESSDVDQS
jgi:hypothetical protein